MVIIEHPAIDYADGSSDSMLRHLGFELNSKSGVDEIYQKLLEEGIQATKPVYVDEYTGYVTMARDPDGRWIEFSYGQDVSEMNWDPPLK